MKLLLQDIFNYDVDSDEEWIDEPGESLSGDDVSIDIFCIWTFSLTHFYYLVLQELQSLCKIFWKNGTNSMWKPPSPTASVVGYASACKQLKVNIASKGEGN